MGRFDALGDGLLEGGNRGTLGQEVRLQDVHDGGDVLGSAEATQRGQGLNAAPGGVVVARSINCGRCWCTSPCLAAPTTAS